MIHLNLNRIYLLLGIQAYRSNDVDQNSVIACHLLKTEAHHRIILKLLSLVLIHNVQKHHQLPALKKRLLSSEKNLQQLRFQHPL